MKNTSVFRILFWLGLALNAKTVAQASPAECQALFEPMKNVGAKTEHFSVSTLPSPAVSKLISTIQATGIDLDRLILKVKSGNRASAELFYDGESIGSAQLQDNRNGVRPGSIYVREIQIHFSYSKRGLGTLLYLVLAREAQKMGLRLESSWDPTPDDKATWNGMVRRGWAKKLDSLFSEIDTVFLDNPATTSSIDTIVRTLAN